MRKPKRPRDTNQLAKAIVDLATGEKMEKVADNSKNPHAAALGKLGGKARAENLSKEERSKIAKQGARARWSKDKK